MPLRSWRRRFSEWRAERAANRAARSSSGANGRVGDVDSDTPLLDQLQGTQRQPTLEEAMALGGQVQSREPARDRAEDVTELNLAAGKTYTISAQDMAAGGTDEVWRKVAKDHGMAPEKLRPFNQHIVELSFGWGPNARFTDEAKLAEGVKIYIPSTQELLLVECRGKASSFEEAVQLYGQIASSQNMAILEKSRTRASGRLGEAYGTAGVDGGVFLTPNARINGASSSRSEMINGQREYRVMWAANFWKCSVFMHDVVFDAGYRPHMNENNHYMLAGRLQESPNYQEVPVQDAKPGDCWQRFGGTRSNESHNAILTSFVRRRPFGDGFELWEMDIVGSENDRAAESTRSHKMIEGTNETDDGKRVRFYRPKFRR
jgi:hypothetical protein